MVNTLEAPRSGRVTAVPAVHRRLRQPGGVLAAAANKRLYWRVRDGLAYSEEVQLVAQLWRETGRTELSTRAVEERLDAYVTALMDSSGWAKTVKGTAPASSFTPQTSGESSRPRGIFRGPVRSSVAEFTTIRRSGGRLR